MSSLHRFITHPALHEYLAILKGARNGLVYGAKVRFPHAVVMSILFGRGDWKSRLKFILQVTRQHAVNLAKFVSLYKILLMLQKKVHGGKPQNADTFFAGLLGGYLVFGERTVVNEQIVLYIAARVVASFVPRASSPTVAAGSPAKPIHPDPQFFSVFSALTLGAGMWLFTNRGQTIQPGMFYASTYLYQESDVWSDLRTLFWHNK